MKMIVAFFAFLLVLSWGSPCVGRSDSNSQTGLESLIEQLGDEDYHVRENAHQELKKAGMKAISLLQKAKNHDDLEISERARELLHSVEQKWTSVQDIPAVSELMNRYSHANTILEKIGLIDELTDWSGRPELNDGQGIGALCRILLYEHEPIVRTEAAREIISAPPARYSSRKKWFRTVLETLEDPGEDDLLQFMLRFVELRDQSIAYHEDTVFSDLPEPPNEHLVQQVRDLGKEMFALRENVEKVAGQLGTDTDILFLYALAEIQDALGMKEELEETLYQALDVAPIPSERYFTPYIAHYMAALYLQKRDFCFWAKNELLMIANKEPRYKTNAYHLAAVLFEYLDDTEKSAEYLGLALKIIEDRRNPGNDFFSGNSAAIRALHQLLLARLAVDQGEITAAKKYLEESVKLQGDAVDALILRYKIGADDPEYHDKTLELIRKSLGELKKEMRRLNPLQGPNEYAASKFNQAAWLLANTEGEYELALNAAKKALEMDPENPSILDTLAHVYALGKEYEKAIETQRTAIQYAPQIKVFRSALKKFEEAADRESL